MYRGISEEELELKYDTLKTKIFDITQLLLNLYEAVENLCEVAVASKTLHTEQQKIKLGVKLIKNTYALEDACAEWVKKKDITIL